MIGARNVKGGLILIAAGLAAGLAMSLYAFEPIVRVPGGLDDYNDLPRRLIRLGHIAAIMLPLLNIAIGGWLDRLNLSARTKQLASWLLLAGAVAVPAALFVEAVWAPGRALHLAALPVIAFCAGVFVSSAGALRTPLAEFARPYLPSRTVVSPAVLKGPVSSEKVRRSSPESFVSPGCHAAPPPPPHP